MINYTQEEEMRIVREMESEIAAVIAIDIHTDAYKIIYTDNIDRKYESFFQGDDFFDPWRNGVMMTVYDDDRARVYEEMSKDNLLKSTENGRCFTTLCRFANSNGYSSCRIKAERDKNNENTLVISIRNIDREIEVKRKLEQLEQDSIQQYAAAC